MAKKPNYEDKFSGSTRALIRTLQNIFLDTGRDVRAKHMFGHKAFMIGGRPFLLAGEWPRKEDKKKGIVAIGERGADVTTLIVLPLDEEAALAIRAEHGGLYFAPSGTRLKHWVSLAGPWLSDESVITPLVLTLLEAYAALPEKTDVANPGRRI